MDELSLISKYIRPLVTKTKEALRLQDDVAVIANSDDQVVQVVTTDCMLEGVHFFKGENPKSIAYRLMISNLSDLASKGATPKFFTLTFCPKSIKELSAQWLETFFNTIKELQQKHKVKLIGGNTASTCSNLMLSITLIGEVSKKSRLPFRFKAKADDLIFISGFLGDAFLGYSIIASEEGLISKPSWLAILNNEEVEYLVNKYYYPKVMLSLGKDLLGVANANTDASDGAMLSINNVCEASGLVAGVTVPMQVFSKVAQKILKKFPEDSKNILPNLINWGGDYNLVFTVPKNKVLLVNSLQKKYLKQGIAINQVGEAIKEKSTTKELITINFNNKNIKLNLNKNIHK